MHSVIVVLMGALVQLPTGALVPYAHFAANYDLLAYPFRLPNGPLVQEVIAKPTRPLVSAPVRGDLAAAKQRLNHGESE